MRTRTTAAALAVVAAFLFLFVARAEDPKPAAPTPAVPTPAAPKPADTKADDKKTEEAKPADAKSDDKKPDDKTAEAKPEAPPVCADCHEQVAAFGTNPHVRGHRKAGDKAPVPVSVCETCHGDGTKHMEAGGDKTLIKVLRGREGTETCLDCHGRSTEHTSFRNGVHASTDQVNCLSCHSIHSADRKEPRLLAKDSVTLCGTCHASQVSSLKTYPYAHRLKPGALSCVSCHVMHSQSGAHAVQQTKRGEPVCVTCHSETRGPFAFEHVVGVAGDCTTCHRPHGSSYPHMLTRATVAPLCLECHSTLSSGTLGSQPPSVHNISLPRWQNCTVCHTAVHGSNRSPQLLK